RELAWVEEGGELVTGDQGARIEPARQGFCHGRLARPGRAGHDDEIGHVHHDAGTAAQEYPCGNGFANETKRVREMRRTVAASFPSAQIAGGEEGAALGLGEE